ncbi:TatD family hydrolase [Saccharospirillum impatiens]|uniref:TatD family hydrolase n=1 Tax=Saccharospirillum impatiens TaxID=169438 RepID=UPI00040D75B6|nr:TatD family hydrolase [Saccharospirillum impatiens]
MTGFDSHCHLDFLDQAGSFMAGAQLSGIGHWLLPGTGPEQWQQAHRQFGDDKRVLLAAGHHPWFLPDGPADTQRLENWLARHNDGVALGEIGLDFSRHRPGTAAAAHQFDWFVAQLAIASERKLPVIIHSVKAHDRILQGLKQTPSVIGVIHGFVGPYAQAMAYVDRGFCLGAGRVIFQSSKTLDAFSRIPADRILVETDAPDQRVPDQYRSTLTPAEQKGSDNPLLDWSATLARLADARQLDPTSLMAQVRRNAAALFGT